MQPFITVIIVVFSINSLLSAVIFFIFLLKILNNTKFTQKTNGTVIDIMNTTSQSGKKLRTPILSFFLNDKEYKIKSKMSIQKWNINIGDKVHLIYPDNHPEKAEIDIPIYKWILPMFFGFGSIFSLIFAVVIYCLFS